MSTSSQKMVKSRANLVMAQPFFGTLALRLKMVEDKSIQTAGCDGVVIRYNPKFVDKLPLSKTMGLIAHEVMHPAFLHHTRRGTRNPEKWNRACDYAINGILVSAGIDLPEGGCINPAYNGMTAEHIYSLLPEEPNTGKTDPGGDGAVIDSPEPQQQQKQVEADWKVAVAQAAYVAKQAGKLPGNLERTIQELFAPVLPWRAILRRFMTEKSVDDFSWKQGNRHFLSQGLYLPSRVDQNTMGEIVVVIDTSGSITDRELAVFGNEIKGIIGETRPPEIIVMYCDSEVAHVDTFSPDDDIQFVPHGGGGTDFRPAFTWLEDRQITPKALVYLTDGYGTFPEHEAHFPVMWAITNKQVTPPHGEHLILEA